MMQCRSTVLKASRICQRLAWTQEVSSSAQPNMWRVLSSSRRTFSSESPSSAQNSNRKSAFAEYFEEMQTGKTALGTTEYFERPRKYLKCGIPEDALRWKTTGYARFLESPFVRPDEHKMTLKVHFGHLPLNDLEMNILREFVGSRMNMKRKELRLQSSQFGSRIENKRHCVSMLERLVTAAQNLAHNVEEEQKALGK